MKIPLLLQAVVTLSVLFASFAEVSAQGAGAQAQGDTTPPFVVGGSVQVRAFSAGATTMLLSFEATDDDPGDVTSLRWTLASTAGLSGGTAEFFGSAQGTSVAIVFTRTSGSTVLGSLVLKVTDDLSATTVVVNLMYGFSPVIEDGAVSVEQVVYDEDTQAMVLLMASDEDTASEELSWLWMGDITTGSSITFVLADGSASATAKGSTATILFKRPSGSAVGESVVVEVRDPQNNTARVTVGFRHVRPPVLAPVVPRLIFASGGELQVPWYLEFPIISNEPVGAVTLTVSVGGEWLTGTQSSITVTTIAETEKTSSYLITFFPLSETVSGAVTYWIDYADRTGDRGVPVAPAKVLTLEHENGCGIEEDGEIFCWGNTIAQPGLDGGIGGLLPPDGGETFFAIGSDVTYSGKSNYCAITDAGKVRCWGTAYSTQPYPANVRYRSVSSMFDGTCAVGSAEAGAPGPIVCRDVPNRFESPPFGDFLSVTGGSNSNACALDQKGKAFCWGSASQTNDPPADKRFSALAVLTNTGACGIEIEEDARPGGRLACWGRTGARDIPGERFLNITAALSSYCGITVEHRMRCWGELVLRGSMAFPEPSADTTLVAVALSAKNPGAPWACALNRFGNAQCWGRPDPPSTDPDINGRLTSASGRLFGPVVSLRPPSISTLRQIGSSGRITQFDLHLDFPGRVYINFVQEGGSTPTAEEVVARAKAGSLLALRRTFESGGNKTLRLPYLGEGDFRAYFVTENIVNSQILATPRQVMARFLPDEPPVLFAGKGAVPGPRNESPLYARLGERFSMEFSTASSETRVTPTIWIGGRLLPDASVVKQLALQDDGSFVVTVETTVRKGYQGAVTYRIEYAKQGVVGVPVLAPQYIAGGENFYCVLLFDGTVKCSGLAVPDDERFTSISASVNQACGTRFDGTVHCWKNGTAFTAPVGSSFRSFAAAADVGCALDVHGLTEGFCTQITTIRVDDFSQSDIYHDLDIGSRQPCGLKTNGVAECSIFGSMRDEFNVFKRGDGAQLSDRLDYMVVPHGENAVCGVKRDDKAIICSADYPALLPAGEQYLTFATHESGACGIALDASGQNANKLVCTGNPGLKGEEYVSVGLFFTSVNDKAYACGITRLGGVLCQGNRPQLQLEGLQKVGFYVDGIPPEVQNAAIPGTFRETLTVSFGLSERSTVYALLSKDGDLTSPRVIALAAPPQLLDPSKGDRFEETYRRQTATARDYFLHIVQEDEVLNRSFFSTAIREIGVPPMIIADDDSLVQPIYAKDTRVELILSASDPNPNEGGESLFWSWMGGLPEGTTVVFVTDAGKSSTARGSTVTILFERPDRRSTLGSTIVVTVTDPEGNTDSLVVNFEPISNRLPVIVGAVDGQLVREIPRNPDAASQTLTFAAHDADPGDEMILRWTLSTGMLTNASAEISGSRQGTGIDIRFMPEVGSSVYGSLTLSVSDQLSTVVVTVQLVYGFLPVIETAESSLLRLIYAKQTQATLRLTARDPDTDPEELSWSIVSGIPLGTTVVFVTDAGKSSTARGSTVTILFVRPDRRSTLGSTIVVEVRDPQNNIVHTTVEFQSVPNRVPVIVGAVDGQLVRYISKGDLGVRLKFQAHDPDPGDGEALSWLLDTEGLADGVTAMLFDDPGANIEMVVERPVNVAEIGSFVLKVSDGLSVTTVVVTVVIGSSPVIEGGADSVRSFIYAGQTQASTSLRAQAEGVSPDLLLWSIVSSDIPMGSTVTFVLPDDSKPLTVSGGMANVLFERPGKQGRGGRVEIEVSLLLSDFGATDRITVIFEAVPNRTPVIVGGSQSRAISANSLFTVLSFEARDDDPGQDADLLWTLNTRFLTHAFAEISGSGRGPGIDVVITLASGPQIFGSFQLQVTDGFSRATETVSLIYGFPPVIEKGESSTVRMIYAKQTQATLRLTARDPDTGPEDLVWSIASNASLGTTAVLVAGAGESSTVRGGEVTLLFRRPDGRSTVGSTIVVTVTDLQNHVDALAVVFKAVPNSPPVIVGGGQQQIRVIAPEGVTTTLLAFVARDDDPGDGADLLWTLSTDMLSNGVAKFYGSEPARRGTSIQILFTRTTGSTSFGSLLLEVTDDLSTATATVNLIYAFSPVIESGESSTVSLIYASQSQATIHLSARDPDGDAKLLSWKVLSGIATGTTAVFVLANGSQSSAAQGSTVTLLFLRPDGRSTVGGSLEIEVRNAAGATNRISVTFKPVANRTPVIVSGSMAVWVIPGGQSSALMTFSATDADPVDEAKLQWSFADTSSLRGGTVEFYGTSMGTNVKVRFRREPPAALSGSFTLKVTDSLADATAVVRLQDEGRLRVRAFLGGATR